MSKINSIIFKSEQLSIHKVGLHGVKSIQAIELPNDGSGVPCVKYKVTFDNKEEIEIDSTVYVD